MKQVVDTLNTIDPRLWPLTIALLAYGAIQLWKSIHPSSFAAVPSRVKMLPAIAVSAIVAGSASDVTDPSALLSDMVIGALSGVFAVGGYEVVTRAAKPRQEPQTQDAARDEPEIHVGPTLGDDAEPPSQL